MSAFKFIQIVDSQTVNGEKDVDYRLRVNADTILNGLAMATSMLFLETLVGTRSLGIAHSRSCCKTYSASRQGMTLVMPIEAGKTRGFSPGGAPVALSGCNRSLEGTCSARLKPCPDCDLKGVLQQALNICLNSRRLVECL